MAPWRCGSSPYGTASPCLPHPHPSPPSIFLSGFLPHVAFSFSVPWDSLGLLRSLCTGSFLCLEALSSLTNYRTSHTLPSPTLKEAVATGSPENQHQQMYWYIQLYMYIQRLILGTGSHIGGAGKLKSGWQACRLEPSRQKLQPEVCGL